MFDLAISITMIMAAIICGGLFWHISVKGFKGMLFAIVGMAMGVAAAYWLFLLVSFIIWLFITMGNVAQEEDK